MFKHGPEMSLILMVKYDATVIFGSVDSQPKLWVFETPPEFRTGGGVAPLVLAK